eukprot:366448-Chlamydomonas_euryale.AAC.9
MDGACEVPLAHTFSSHTLGCARTHRSAQVDSLGSAERVEAELEAYLDGRPSALEAPLDRFRLAFHLCMLHERMRTWAATASDARARAEQASTNQAAAAAQQRPAAAAHAG